MISATLEVDMLYSIRFKSGMMTAHVIHGFRELPTPELTERTDQASEESVIDAKRSIAELISRIPQIETDLEQLLGHRVHIEQRGPQTIKE
jgi:hypothetical protein